MKVVLICVLSIFIYAGLRAQNNQIPVEIAQDLYGTSDKLVNGIVYLPLHPKASGVPYYPYSDYHNGNIFISGDEFKNEMIKYDIELQHLVLKKKLRKDAEPEVLLFNNRIDSFSFDNRMFINSRFIADSLIEEGFYELIHRGEHTYFSFHKIFFKSDYDRKNPYGKYHTPIRRYYRLSGNKLIKFKNKNQFTDLFDPHQSEIRKFMRKNHIKFRKISSEEMKSLIRYSEKLN